MSNRRLGKFQVTEKFLTLDNIAARRLMEKVVVLQAEYRYIRDVIEFTALCEDFDDCPFGMIPPTYSAIVSMAGDRVTIKFEKEPRS